MRIAPKVNFSTEFIAKNRILVSLTVLELFMSEWRAAGRKLEDKSLLLWLVLIIAPAAFPGHSLTGKG